MIEQLPKDVMAEMREVMEEMELFNLPPEDAFTVKQYYDNYLLECDRKEISEKFRYKLEGIRYRLDKLVDEEKMNRGTYTLDGSPTVFYWRKE